MTNQTDKRWPWYMILLWAYSVFCLAILTIVSIFFSSTTVAASTTTTDSIVTGILATPILIFVLIQGISNLRN